MTNENPWPAGGSDLNPAAAERDPFRSLGLGFTEESPTIEPSIATALDEISVEPDAPVDAPWVTESSIMATTPTVQAPLPGTDLIALPPAASTELVATSRRARRDAERTVVSARRPRRDETAPRRFASRAVRRASAPATSLEVRPPAGPLVPVRATAVSAQRMPLSRRIAKKTFPPVVMLAVAALLVGTSVPANALFDPEAPPASLALSSLSAMKAEPAEIVELEGQVIEAEVADELVAAAATRDEWGVTSYAEMLTLRYGSISYAYSTSGAGAVRWPFAFAAPIVSAFGDRAAPCYGCSSYHRGLDFDAGYGAPIGAIADGVVTYVGYGGGWGYRVEIEHVVNGQKVTSLYAHMIDASSSMQVGQPIVTGQLVGAVGSTGLSTGPHLHLEIHIDDIPVDPYAWLVANAS